MKLRVTRVTDSSEDTLEHHGIEGQKWGVRRGPPYPIEDKTLRKGERLKSTTYKYANADSYKKSGVPMYTYNSNDEWDRKVYTGPFAKYNILYRGAMFIAEHEYEVVKDLKMPTKQERMDEFKDLYNSKKFGKKVLKEMRSVQDRMVKIKVGNEKDQEMFKNVNLKNLKTEDDWKAAYMIFNHAMEAAHAFKSTSEYLKRMSDKYDAMVDDNNQGWYNDAHDPVIIFRANEALKSIGTKYLTTNDILDSYNSVSLELAKKGELPKL